MSGHIAGQPLECFVNQVILQKTPLIDNKGAHVQDEAGNPRFICGFRIAGGIDQDNTKSPQGYPDKGIYVTYIHEGGPAEMAGLKVHDKILQVNGRDMTMATHKKAVDYISRKSILEMFVYRLPDENIGSPRRGTNIQKNNINSNLNNLENQLNKMKVHNAGEQSSEGLDGRSGGQTGDHRFLIDTNKDKVQPQYQPRNYYGNQPNYAAAKREDGHREYGRHHGDEYAMNQQQSYYRPQMESPAGESRNFGYHQQSYPQYQNTPMKPPRLQQPPSMEQHHQQRTDGMGRSVPNRYPEIPHNAGRIDNQNSAFDNQMGRPNSASNYHHDERLMNYPATQMYHSPGYQVQPQRYESGNQSDDLQHSDPQQQQRAYEYSQQRSGYGIEKRSNNPNLSNPNKFY